MKHSSSSAYAGLIFSSPGGAGTAWRSGGGPSLACSVTRKPPFLLCIAGILIVKERVVVLLVSKVKNSGELEIQVQA